MSAIQDFEKKVLMNVEGIGKDRDFLGLGNIWIREAVRHEYAYNFSWLGRPIIQIPQDIYAIQELIWKVRPDLVIETGVAHGGSLIMSASVLALLDYTDAVMAGKCLDPRQGCRRVIGVDIDIRKHNRDAIENHPLSHMITLLEGSSVEQGVLDQVKSLAQNFNTIMVFLDSNHTHDHVLRELEAYGALTTPGSYCVVWDTGIEDLPEGYCIDRLWGKGNNPKTAVWKYLNDLEKRSASNNDQGAMFVIDKEIEYKLAITAASDGFLKRIR